MRLPVVLALAALSLAPLAAIHAPAAPADADSEAGFDNVDVLDASLNGKVSVVRVGSQHTNTGLLSIFASLKNLTGHAITIQAQTLYKDGDGNWLDGGKAGWVSITLKPHEELEYRSASLSDDAQDFLVRIRTQPALP
jgi:hypothetical protein